MIPFDGGFQEHFHQETRKNGYAELQSIVGERIIKFIHSGSYKGEKCQFVFYSYTPIEDQIG